MVRHRADAAQPLHHHRHLPVRAAADEGLEAAELDDVQPRLAHAVVLVEQQRHLAVALHARQRVDGDAAQAACGSGGGSAGGGGAHRHQS
jgi:prolyl-tRNA editing enzyme YbaK/EbsC (Cys-tRNA(Pro) deacylase)